MHTFSAEYNGMKGQAFILPSAHPYRSIIVRSCPLMLPTSQAASAKRLTQFLVTPSECKSFDGRPLTRIYFLEISFITESAEEAWRNFIAFLCMLFTHRVVLIR